MVARSTDHGRTFSHSIVDTNFDFPFNEAVGSLILTGENFRIDSYPQLAYDPVTDRLALSWNDDRNGRYTDDGESIRTNGDTIVASSRGGRDWTVRVIGTPQDEVYSAIAVGADLRLHPCWTDFRGRPGVTAPNQDAYTQSISFLS